MQNPITVLFLESRKCFIDLLPPTSISSTLRPDRAHGVLPRRPAPLAGAVCDLASCILATSCFWATHRLLNLTKQPHLFSLFFSYLVTSSPCIVRNAPPYLPLCHYTWPSTCKSLNSSMLTQHHSQFSAHPAFRSVTSCARNLVTAKI